MRSVSAPLFLQAAISVLESSVVPSVDDPAARRRLLICIGLLDNLVGRIEDRRSLLTEEADLLRSLIGEPPTVETDGEDADPADEVHALRQLVSTRLRARRWSEADAAGDSDDWLEQCHEVLTAINAFEISRLRPTRYGQANSVRPSSPKDGDDDGDG